MDVQLETITPKKAMMLLSMNTANRVVSQARVNQMVHDLKSGAFTACPAPISFYEDGSLADGQHRLWAVVESEVTHDFLILRDLPKDAGLNIDTHRPRTLVDNARITGMDTDITNNLVSTARVIATGSRSTRGDSFAEKLATVKMHKEAALWALRNGPHGTAAKYFKNSLIWGAIGRAYYVEKDEVRLAEFGTVVGTGFYGTPDDSAAIALRNYIVNNPVSQDANVWQETFWKAQNALHLFMRRKPLSLVKIVNSERYPLKGTK